jgi:pilus assembly protein CpaB
MTVEPVPTRRRWSMALCAVLAGSAAAWAARHHIQGQIERIEADARMPMVQRLVAAYDLAAGSPLLPDDVALRDMPEQWAPGEALAADAGIAWEGRILAHPLRRGDPILPAHLAAPREAPLSAKVESGRRAVTIPVDDISSQSGMLQPGDLLDLYVSFEHRGRRITAPLLQGMLVLATGGQADPQAETAASGFATVTLDAGPEDAVKLVAARQAGSITAILRHRRDAQPSPVAVRGDLATLLGIDGARDTERVIPVLYGDQLSGMSAAVGDAPPVDAGGIFQAPVPAELTSTARRRRQTGGAAGPMMQGGLP